MDTLSLMQLLQYERLGKKYLIHITTERGKETFEADNIENALLSLLAQLKQKGTAILDLRVDRGTLEQHFISMTGGQEK